MNLLEQLLASGNGTAVDQLSAQFGLDAQQTQSAISQLLPALASGLQYQASQAGGLESLLGTLGGAAQQFSNDPGSLAQPGASEFGAGVLGQIFGGNDVTQAVTDWAAAATGIGSNVLQQMLPMVATLLMGTLARQQGSPGAMAASAEGGGGLEGMLGGLLGSRGQTGGGGLMDLVSGFVDQNRDGSMVDDVIRMLGNRR
jgi:hypothetical protein